jgi:hypothetical protein
MPLEFINKIRAKDKKYRQPQLAQYTLKPCRYSLILHIHITDKNKFPGVRWQSAFMIWIGIFKKCETIGNGKR